MVFHCLAMWHVARSNEQLILALVKGLHSRLSGRGQGSTWGLELTARHLRDLWPWPLHAEWVITSSMTRDCFYPCRWKVSVKHNRGNKMSTDLVKLFVLLNWNRFIMLKWFTVGSDNRYFLHYLICLENNCNENNDMHRKFSIFAFDPTRVFC